MHMKHRHLRQEDRGVIYRMNKAGKTQVQIAEAIGFTQSSVSKELKRNRGKKGYRIKQSQNFATLRKNQKRHRDLIISNFVEDIVVERITRKHSPEQISGWLAKVGIKVSHETIYKYLTKDKLSGGDLYTHLRINSKRRYRRRIKTGRVGKILGRVGLENRPKIVDHRKRFGDWEVDLIEGSKGSGFLLSLYERKSRLGKLVYLENKGATGTASAIIETLQNYRVKTLTYDNGLEFAQHARVSNSLNAKAYFCAPYHSWEKGGVENFNGLVRQYYPKGSSFHNISQEHLESVEDAINQRPRKTLDYKSPSELENKFAA